MDRSIGGYDLMTKRERFYLGIVAIHRYPFEFPEPAYGN
jgi:hypothetical protein